MDKIRLRAILKRAQYPANGTRLKIVDQDGRMLQHEPEGFYRALGADKDGPVFVSVDLETSVPWSDGTPRAVISISVPVEVEE